MSDFFHDVIMPEYLAFGSTGGPAYKTEILQTASGFECRNAFWAHSLRQYNLISGARPLNELRDLVDFFEARRGRLYGFLWRDWMDDHSANTSTHISAFDQILESVNEDRTIFKTQKQYGAGDNAVVRRIFKPRAEGFLLARDGTVLTQNEDYTLDATMGRVTLNETVPTDERITAGFYFYVPVRFDTDMLDVQLSSFDMGVMPSIALVELKLSEPEDM